MLLPFRQKALALAICSAFVSGAVGAAEEDSVELSDLEVIGTTPIGGVGLEADRIPTKTQSASADDIERVQSLDISDLLNRTLGSVNISAAQNNPFQPNLNYRGFTASPLVGSAQGLSVYMDGVRVNEPFGDAINFELIPESAINSINLVSGSNPVFGLNTLGGALSIQTKNGFNFEGHELEAYTGSFGRDSGTISSGGNDGTFGYFVTGSITKEDGWRDFSPSRVEQLFSNLSYRKESTSLDLTLMSIESDLNGNGASPVELVAQDRAAVFTHPDNTQNDLDMVVLNGSHWVNDDLMIAGNTYFRASDRSTFNGDGGEFESDGNADGDAIIDDDGDPIRTSAGPVTLGDFDDDDFDVEAELEDGDFEVEGLGLNNRSETEQDSWGFGLQTTSFKDLFGKENQLTVGISYDRSDVDYTANSEIAYLTETRGTVGTGIFLLDEQVDGRIKTDTYSIFFTNTHSLTDRLDLTVGARYNWIAIDISGTSKAGDQNLNESGETHDFKRLNPTVGLTYAIQDNLTTYASYSESNRAPTPSELTCSEGGENSCAYPNAFLADPPLDDVVARTLEAGFRGVNNGISWSAGAFYTELKDDLFFFNEADDDSPVLNKGVFDNIDKTARAGLELSASASMNKLSWFAHYSYIRATFEDDFDYNREVDEEDTTFSVSKGDRLPNQPEHNFNVGVDYAFTDKLSLGSTALYRSSQHLRGDEANVDDEIGGYTVVNLHGRYKLNKNIEFFGRVDNLFDKEYSSFGLYGEPGEAGLEDFENPRFVGAGAPRAGWVGIKVSL
jgi:outer membrane receptor protein involved in Fe transport